MGAWSSIVKSMAVFLLFNISFAISTVLEISVVNELSMHYPAKYKDLNKFELKTFDNLHKIIRSDSDWLDFTKLFMLYLEGILSLQDMFMLFEDKFGH